MAFSGENPNDSNTAELGKTELAQTGEGIDISTHVTQHSSSSPPPFKRASTTPLLSAPSSAVTSPKPSREASPIRPPLKPGTSEGSKGPRSRKNSHDLSPTRAPGASVPYAPTVPSAAAIQRALSVAGIPQLQPLTTSDLSIDAPRPHRPNKAPNAGGNQWGTNLPRVKSPPPVSNKASVLSVRKPEQTIPTPSIFLERPTSHSGTNAEADTGEEDNLVHSGMRTPSRVINASGSTLETVQESSLPATPAIGTGWAQLGGRAGTDERPERIDENPMEDAFGKEVKTKTESGSDSGGNKSAGTQNNPKATQKSGITSNAVKPQIVHSQKSFTQLHPAKGKTGSEGTVKNMTVETETVSSIPQVALGGGAGERSAPGRSDTAGTLRLKPSTETIRPKKDKKKVLRKAPSINSGTGSSKADIFEAKIASAVDEANSSDSEETFVYESNPPEPLSARPQRFHSRTPSATSTISQVEHYGPRVWQDGHHSIAGKKSMKFANTTYHVNDASEQGTVRGPSQSGRTTGGSSTHRHHIGRHGRGGHTSLFDNDSPFNNGAKPLRSTVNNVAQLSPRPSSSRSPHISRIPGSSKKPKDPLLYDLEGEGADDERTPLIGSARSGRNRIRTRPLSGSSRHDYSAEKDHRFCRRVTACVSLGSLVALLIAAVVVILIMCSQPLIDVHVKDIQNVLASEQEIMLDLDVHAINPNLIAVQVSDLDVNIFAKSKHVGTSAFWRNEHSQQQGARARKGAQTASVGISQRRRASTTTFHSADGVDEGTDPIDDPETDSQTMLLGRIFEFDSPLIFNASPIRRQPLSSIGEVRLAKPGNRTEEGGSERWEKVIQHDFELIVRGVIRYSFPISSKTRSAKIGGTVIVHPGNGLDRMGSMAVSIPTHPYPAGSNVLVHRPKQKTAIKVTFVA